MEQRSIDDPNERRPYVAHGHMDVVTLGDFTLGRGTFEPVSTASSGSPVVAM